MSETERPSCMDCRHLSLKRPPTTCLKTRMLCITERGLGDGDPRHCGAAGTWWEPVRQPKVRPKPERGLLARIYRLIHRALIETGRAEVER